MSNHSNDKDKTAGTAGGALAGAAAGAALGTLIPGVGNVVGAVIGGAVGVAGGAAVGNLIAGKINPEEEDKYWQQNYSSRPYGSQASYDELQPAYRYGWETRGQYPTNQRFSDVESDLGQKWETSRGNSKLGWDKAKHASRDAWDRIERALPGDFDKDGK